MKNIICLIFTGLFFIHKIALAVDVDIKSEEAREWANNKGHELIQVLGTKDIVEKHSKLDKMLTEDVNLDYISKFVIGKYLKTMNKDQKRRYSALFERYILSLYKQFNLHFDSSDIAFSIDNVVEHPKFTVVSCSIDANNILKNIENLEIERLPVEFRLIRGKENRIQAVDIEISNVSMVIEYRKKFYKMIMEENEEIEWFLEKFEDKIIANEMAASRVSNL
ncbi:MAG: ABC transporter substrate-binding protein [Alphaproteobacteria bacterium]|nr:ABC transporter substrate-binding protein [Alphaproteobacteria bacterium]